MLTSHGSVLKVNIFDCRRLLPVLTIMISTENDFIQCGLCTFVISNSALYRSCRNSSCGKDCTSLDASSRGLQQVTLDVFYGLSALSEVRLGVNRLVSFPPNAFVGLSKLTILDLSGNLLETLDSNIFKGLTDLTTLDLSYNLFQTVPDRIFNGLVNLSLLDLTGNQLTSLTPASMFGIQNLTNLQLSNNQLVTLAPDVFIGMYGLKILDLGANQLNLYFKFPSSIFASLVQLRELHLQFNSLESVPSFIALTNLIWLDLHHNSISTIMPNTFFSLRKLERLDLSFNLLKRLGNALDNSKNLRELYLGGNQLLIPLDSISGLGGLRILHLQENNFSMIPTNAFMGLGGLVWLNLAGNSIRNVSYLAFNSLANLEILDLDHNLLQHLPVDFAILPPVLPALSELFLSYNLLSSLSADSFSGLIQLSSLSLSYNQLSEISFDAFLGTKLCSISLLGNSVLKVNAGVFSVNQMSKNCKLYVSDSSCIPQVNVPRTMTTCIINSQLPIPSCSLDKTQHKIRCAPNWKGSKSITARRIPMQDYLPITISKSIQVIQHDIFFVLCG